MIKFAAVAVMTVLSGVVGTFGQGRSGNAPAPNPNATVACEQRGTGVPRFCSATPMEVVSNGVGAEQGQGLALALGNLPFASDPSQAQPGDAFVENRVFKYLDPANFHAVPTLTIPRGSPPFDPNDPAQPGDEGTSQRAILDVPAITRMLASPPAVIMGGDAIARVKQKLGEFLPAGAKGAAFNSKLQLAYNTQQPEPVVPGIGNFAELLLDTQVSLTQFMPCAGQGCPAAAIPVVGPGAKISVTLNPDGVVTQAQYAARGLAESSKRVEVVDPTLGPEICGRVLGLPPEQAGGRLVYYAPEIRADMSPAALLPHFACEPSAGTDPGEGLPLARFVPAVVNVPTASITDLATDGLTITATGSATGGTPPYSFSWSSAATTGDQPAAGPTTTYTIVPRGGGVITENLLLTVEDANGLVAQSVVEVQIDSGIDDAMAGEPTHGSHGWTAAVQVGADGGTYSPDCTPYVNGWRDWTNAGGIPGQFLYYANYAWSTDFQKPGIGQDHHYADDVDAMFYCGHGSKGSFTFENISGPTDKNVTPGEMQLGDWDLEWFFLLSCQVLQENWSSSSWTATWGQSFNGMHAMYGFHTNAAASGNLGRDIAKYMLGVGVAAKTVHNAYVQASIDSQPSDRIGVALYPVSYSYEWNANDWFWGEGSGPDPDIPASQIYYWARITWGT